MRISHLWRVLPILAALVSVNPATAAEPTSFPLKDGDTWVMAGDSITAQKLHCVASASSRASAGASGPP